MEEFLPILIGIIWLAYTLYNRGQKKKNARKHQPAETREDKTPSFIEQLLMGEETIQPQPYESSEHEFETGTIQDEFDEAQREKESIKPFLNEELADFMHEGQSVSMVNKIDEIENEEDAGFDHITDEFDLKKAVIFSEILNAPYIDYK
ncbi:MAG: hypothetical protein K8R86_13090 [Bacteroidales bacterium]|nr:hypothetical protein [Bacteroidales bacterium]